MTEKERRQRCTLTATNSNMAKTSNTKSKSKSKYYAVAIGRTVGIFDSWSECERQVKGFSGAIYKCFPAKNDAQAFLQKHRYTSKSSPSPSWNELSSEALPSIRNSSKRSISHQAEEETSPSYCVPPPAKKRPRVAAASSTRMTTLTESSSTDATITHADLSLLLSFDGGSRGNPGLAGSGAEVVSVRVMAAEAAAPPPTTGTSSSADTTRSSSNNNNNNNNNKILKTRSKTRLMRFLRGKQTNNQAEYWGLIVGLECVFEKLSCWMIDTSIDSHENKRTSNNSNNNNNNVKVVHLTIQGDSNLVIQQMKGAYKVGDSLRPNYQCAQEWMHKIRELCHKNHNITLDYSLQHVYRKDNAIADQCANYAMDAQKSWSVHIDSEGEETRTEMPDIEPNTSGCSGSNTNTNTNSTKQGHRGTRTTGTVRTGSRRRS